MRHAVRRYVMNKARSAILAIAIPALALVAGCSSPVPSSQPPSPLASTPSVSQSVAPSTGTASPSAAFQSSAPSGGAGPQACASRDVTATGGPWGGAAGSRGADVKVANSSGGPCLLTANPVVVVIDPGGAVVLQSQPQSAGSGPSAAPGTTFGFSVRMSNWCDQSVRLPLRFRLVLPSGSTDIAAVAITSIDQLPPCNGPGQPPALSTSNWESQ